MSHALRVLLVGAGAVGQVCGLHLDRAGATVDYYVKPAYKEDTRKGFSYAKLRAVGTPKRGIQHKPHDVITELEELATRYYDHVYLCISSTALCQGTWFQEFCAVLHARLLICFQPSPLDQEFVERHWASKDLIMGMIGFLAYQGPLKNEDRFPKNTLVYWFPPMTPCLFSGVNTHRDEVLKVLSAGGLPVGKSKDAGIAGSFGTAALTPLLVGLELECWSWSALRRSEWINIVTKAQREAIALIAIIKSIPTPSWRSLLKPGVTGMALGLVPSVTPLDMETFFEYHFTKVGDQTRNTMTQYLDLGAQHGLEVTHIQQLHDALEAQNKSRTTVVT